MGKKLGNEDAVKGYLNPPTEEAKQEASSLADQLFYTGDGIKDIGTEVKVKRKSKKKKRTVTYDCFALNLAEARRRRNLTQGQLADLVGVSQPVISSYEKNKAAPGLCLLIAFSQILDVTTDELLGLKSNPKFYFERLNRSLLPRKSVEKLKQLSSAQSQD